MNPDDEVAIPFIRPQNEAAIEALIRKYHRRLKVAAISVLRRAMSPEAADVEADDVLQEIYTDVWEKGIESVKKSLAGYLIVRTRYKAIDRIRGRLFQVDIGETWEGVRIYRPKRVYEPREYVETYSAPFADIWGRQVPNTRWDFAEVFSLAPMEWAKAAGQLESLFREDYPIVYYLSLGASFEEISELLDLPMSLLRKRLTRVKERLRRKLSPSARRQYNFGFRLKEATPPPTWSAWSIQQADTRDYLRKLSGYVPEWIIWFNRLSDHTKESDEPITFGVIKRLARESDLLSEQQGKRFLLAATSDQGALLTQRFFQIRPHSAHRLLSFSDIYQLLRKQSVGRGEEWMDQIATAWVPTSKWHKLRFRW